MAKIPKPPPNMNGRTIEEQIQFEEFMAKRVNDATKKTLRWLMITAIGLITFLICFGGIPSLPRWYRQALMGLH